jgi:hypothetical protein
MVGMDNDSSLLHATVAAANALERKLRTIGFFAMNGYPIDDRMRFEAVADNLELAGLRRDRAGAGVTR